MAIRLPSGTASIPVATPSANGLESAADKTKLDGIATGATANTGTVTTVGLNAPAPFSVSGSPVTSTGSLALGLAAQSANTVFAGPSSGAAATPTMRALTAADIPFIATGRGKSSTTTYYHLPGVEATSISTAGPGANTLRYGAIKVDTPITFDALVNEVTTAGSSGQGQRLGLYAANSDWQPTSLIVDTGAISVTTTGVKIGSFTAITLQPGRYLTAILSDSSGLQCRAARGGAMYVGYDTGLGTSAFLAGLTVSRTYGALPTTPVAWDTVITSSAPLAQLVWLRITTP